MPTYSVEPAAFRRGVLIATGPPLRHKASIMNGMGLRLTLAVVLLCATSLVHSQANTLDLFVDRDLWKLARAEHAQLKAAVGWVSKDIGDDPVPWRLWKSSHNRAARYILLLARPLRAIPDGSSAAVQLFDDNGKKTKNWSFKTGWRIDLADADLEYSAGLNADLIVLHMRPVINGRNIAEEFYALSDDHLRLVRLEDDRGQSLYDTSRSHEIGIPPSARTLEQWIALLAATDKADVLSALFALDGQSVGGDVFNALTASPSFHGVLDRLSRSDNEWIKEAASRATWVYAVPATRP